MFPRSPAGCSCPHLSAWPTTLTSTLLRLAFPICSVLLGGLVANRPAGGQDPHADRPPNIVLILADDLGYETVGCYGGTSYRTPRLDGLAREGIRFDQAFAMPLCTNTRVQLMTGKYNLRNWRAFGILDPEETTFGHLMQAAGYRTCIAGKWQLTSYDPPDYPGAERRRNTGMRPEDAGFEETCLWHTGHTEKKGSRYADPVIFQNGKRLAGTPGQYGPDIWVDFIGDFMERHREEPFFVYYPMALPHNPMVPTPDSPEWDDPAMRHRDETRFAAGMIEYTDKLVGRLVDKIDSLGLGEQTLVLFTSDNGTNSRVQSRLGDLVVRGEKGLGTDLGIRVPTIARWTGTTPPGVVSPHLVDSVDFLPTLLEIAGHADRTPEGLDGRSFAGTVRGDVRPHRDWVYIHQDPRPGWDKDRFRLIRLARGPRYKLYEDGRLFDLQTDPLERSPIFVDEDDEGSRQARLTLQQVLDSMKPYPHFDPGEVPRPNPRAAFRDDAFQDQGGLIVAEAELLPTPRDESWNEENRLDRYTGLGYLRAIRDQAQQPQKGITRLAVKANTSGNWQIAVRCRSDHPDGSENELWVKVGQGDWQVARIGDVSPGNWQWVTASETPAGGEPEPLVVPLEERRNHIWIAPKTANLKLDRIVLFQPDRREAGLRPTTPASPFHPW